MENIRTVCLEMLNQRGYKIIESKHNIIAKRKDDHIVIFMVVAHKLNIERFQEYIKSMNKMKIRHAIIIYRKNVTPKVKKIVKNSDIKIELFTADKLQYNITKHRLVPKHIRLEKKDSEQFKKIYGTKIPVLLKQDPVRRFYDYEIGDIIKIIRGGNFVSYRIVKE